MSEQHLSTEHYQRAIQIAERIEKLEGDLKELLSGRGGKVETAESPVETRTPKAAGKAKRKGKRAGRVVSPEARERIAAAQRARWAKTKQG